MTLASSAVVATGGRGEVIGVDWGGTRFRAGLVRFDDQGFRVDSMLDRRWSPSGSWERDLEWAAQVLDELGRPDLPVGVALAAMLDSRSGRLWNAPNLHWDIPADGVDFGSEAQAKTGRPVALLNDLSAATLGEFHFGAGGRDGHLLSVFLGTGLGAGYVADGRLVEGARGVALELGHLTVRPQGRLCGCGRRGCLEAYVGGRHLLERLAEDAGPGGPVRSSEVWRLAGGRVESLHPGLVDRACDSGDAYACELWDEVAGLLGEGVASAVTLLDPGRVVFGGTVFAGCPNLVTRTIQQVRGRSNVAALVGLEFVSAVLGDLAGLIGAALVARRL